MLSIIIIGFYIITHFTRVLISRLFARVSVRHRRHRLDRPQSSGLEPRRTLQGVEQRGTVIGRSTRIRQQAGHERRAERRGNKQAFELDFH